MEIQWGMEHAGMTAWLGTQGVATQELKPSDTLGSRVSLFISCSSITHTYSSFKTNHGDGKMELVISGYQAFSQVSLGYW